MVVQIEQSKSALHFLFRSLLVSLLVFIFWVDVSAQRTNFSREMKYVEYLKEKRMYAEAQYVLTMIDTATLSAQQADSLNFERGGIYLLSNSPDSSIRMFNKVSESSNCFSKALLANAYNYWHGKQYQSSNAFLKKALNNTNDSSLQPLVLLMLSANELLQNHPSMFSAYSKMIVTGDELIEQKKAGLNKVYQSEIAFHRKSPVVAGVMSAIIPGLGKWYAGKPSEALGAFIPLASLGLLSYEAYKRGGINSIGFVSFASLFSVFYAGNIWGSIVSVKLRNESFKENNEKNIAVSMLVPIDRLLR